MESKQTEFDFEKIMEGKQSEAFLRFMAEKYQESYDGNMRGLLENDSYLSHDEIELILENHQKSDKETIKEQLQKTAHNKFEDLEKLAFYPNFMEAVPLLAEGFHSFTQGLKKLKDGQKQENGELGEDFSTKSSQLNIKHLDTFFENAPISKQHLDGLIQKHSPNPNRLMKAMEEQFFPHILLPHDEKQAIQAGIKNYIKTMSQVVQSGAILMDKTHNTFSYLESVNMLEDSPDKILKADSIKDLSEKMPSKKQGMVVYQDHNIMYALIKNFGKNFNQSFRNNRVQSTKKAIQMDDSEYQLRKKAVDKFVKQLEKVVGKQAGVELLKSQTHDISLGKFSEIIKINEVESRFYLVKQKDKFLVSLLPIQSPRITQKTSPIKPQSIIPKRMKSQR
jgi:hypothetical protein